MLMTVGGCSLSLGPRSYYVLKARPAADGLERELKCWSGMRDGLGQWRYADLDSARLAALSAAYSSHRTLEDGRVHLFTDTLRPGLSRTSEGHADFVRYTTSLGTASLYVERRVVGRYRGLTTDDLLRQMLVLDRSVDLHAGWFAECFRRHRDASWLRDRLRGQFRQDLHGLAWGVFLGMTRQGQDTWPLALQYLAERGYFSWRLADMDEQIGSDDASEWVFDLMVAFLGKELRKAGKRSPAEIEALLREVRRRRPTIADYVRKSAAYRRLAVEHRRAGAEAPDPMDLLMPVDSLVVERLWESWKPGRKHYWSEVVLELPSPPVETNGSLQEGRGEVVWTDPDSMRIGHPQMWYATWVQPDSAFQAMHFGSIHLSAQRLWAYSLWRKELSGELAEQWEGLLAGLAPATWKRQVRSFRFRHQETVSDSAAMASEPWNLLLFELHQPGR